MVCIEGASSEPPVSDLKQEKLLSDPLGGVLAELTCGTARFTALASSPTGKHASSMLIDF